MEPEKTNWKPVPLAMDAALKREVEAVAKALDQKQASVMRDAIRKGLPLVKSGGKVVNLSAELAHFVASNAERFNRTEDSILAEAVERGVRAVELHALIEQLKAEGGMTDSAAEAMLKRSSLTVYPEQRAVREAMLERGELAIQLDDLLRHCPEARERKELIEKHGELIRKRYGTGPSMWGSGVSTEHLKQNIATFESEIAKGAGPGRETESLLETLEELQQHGPRYFPKSIQVLKPERKPKATESESAPPRAPSSEKPAKRAKKKPGK